MATFISDRRNILDRLPIFLLIITTSLIAYFIVINAQWIYGDDFEFLITTAIGKIEWEFHLKGGGRFLPLCHFDYNILTVIPFGTTPTAHYIIVAVSFIFFVCCSFYVYYLSTKKIQSRINLTFWLIYFLIIFLSYYFNRVFFHLFYSERIIIVLLSLFILMYYSYIKTKKTLYLLFSILISIYITYCKETIFIIFISIALVNLVIRYNTLDKQEKYFYIFLVMNGLIFLSLYYFISFKNATSFYKGGNDPNLSYIELLKFTLGNLKILWLGLLLMIWIVINRILYRDSESLFFFSLLFSGLSFAIACFILKLQQPYYYFPAVVLVFPAIVFYILNWIKVEYLLAAMFIFSVHYGKKFPDAIRNYQDKRTSTKDQINQIINYINRDYKCFWFFEPTQDTTQKLHKFITEVFVNHNLGRMGIYKFEEISSIPNHFTTNTIIFCEDNPENKRILKEKGLKEMDIDQIWDTIAYIK